MMMIKRFRKFLFVSGIIMVGCQKKNSDFEIKITKQDAGYGYQIIKKKRILINQPYIPAINKQLPFKNSMEAHKTANLVMSKIGKLSLPRVSVQELDSMNITY
ncbi:MULTISPECIES: DUF4907 domain-containing protein [Chryseobacterium]|nr:MULTISPECIES: DUF4907 domain-containing protein [Chryseobacterium]UMQ43735.1 DUF4907 domain-containing protein [Chryseobacterium sp. Y16C]